eukprot:Awhi_evm5s1128
MEDAQPSSSTDPVEGGPKFDAKYFKQRKVGSGVKKGTKRGPYNTIAKKNKLLIDDGVDVINKQQRDINKQQRDIDKQQQDINTGLNIVNKQRQDLDLIEGQVNKIIPYLNEKNEETDFSNAREGGSLAATKVDSFYHPDDRESDERDNELLVLRTEMEMIKLWMTGNLPVKNDNKNFDYENYFDIDEVKDKERISKQMGNEKDYTNFFYISVFKTDTCYNPNIFKVNLDPFSVTITMSN